MTSPDDARVFELKPNETGFHVLALGCGGDSVAAGEGGGCLGLEFDSIHTGRDQFNIYKDEYSESLRFGEWVAGLEDGTVVAICITVRKSRAGVPPHR